MAAVGLVSIVWLANASLAVADDYDFGLYHLNLIDYAKRYAALPGLADLHVRLGAGDAHLLFVALLDRGPLSGAGPHLADGLLASLLIFDLVRRFVFRPASAWFSSFTSTLALLLIPIVVIVAALRPTQRISSPNLDFAAFVLVVVGILYLAECVEDGFARSRRARRDRRARNRCGNPPPLLALGRIRRGRTRPVHRLAPGGGR